MIALLRRTGADPPFSDHRRYHGVPMEGWFWRFTDAAAGTVCVVLCSVNRDWRGGTWGMCAVAVRTAATGASTFAEGVSETASADARGTVRVGELLHATGDRLRVTLPGAEVDVALADPVRWPRRALGGIGPGHLVPWLGQYWHPHVLGGRAHGAVRVADVTVSLDGSSVYAEKNWGRGFPEAGWWWGQAQGFPERDDACVAFAGGPLGPLRAGALVVRLGDELIHVVRPPLPLRASDGAGPWSLRARTARAVVEVEVSAPDAPLRLPVPVPEERGVVHGPSEQHLAASLSLRVRRGARTVFDATAPLAGFELGSPTRRGGTRSSAPS